MTRRASCNLISVASSSNITTLLLYCMLVIILYASGNKGLFKVTLLVYSGTSRMGSTYILRCLFFSTRPMMHTIFFVHLILWIKIHFTTQVTCFHLQSKVIFQNVIHYLNFVTEKIMLIRNVQWKIHLVRQLKVLVHTHIT